MSRNRLISLGLLILSIGLFLALCFQVYYQSLFSIPVPSKIGNLVLKGSEITFLFFGFLWAYFWFLSATKKVKPVLVVHSFRFAIVMFFFLLPEFIYFFYPLRLVNDSLTQLYLLVEVFLLNSFFSFQFFSFQKFISKTGISFKKILFIVLFALIVLGLVIQFPENKYGAHIRSFYFSISFVIASYLVISNLSLIAKVAQQNLRSRFLQLLFLSFMNCFLFYHFYYEENNGLYNILSVPSHYYVSLMLLPLIFSLLFTSATLFFISFSSVFFQKENEIKNLKQMNRFIKDKMQIEDIFRLLLNNAVSDTKAKAGWLIIEDENGSRIKTKNINLAEVQTIQGLTLPFENNFDWIAHNGILLIRQKLKFDFTPLYSKFNSLIIFKFDYADSLNAKMYLAHDEAGYFEEESIEIIQSYIEHSYLAYENLKLFASSIKAEEVNKELAIASHIQKNLLPKKFPQHQDYEIASFIEPSKNLGVIFLIFISSASQVWQ